MITYTKPKVGDIVVIKTAGDYDEEGWEFDGDGDPQGVPYGIDSYMHDDLGGGTYRVVHIEKDERYSDDIDDMGWDRSQGNYEEDLYHLQLEGESDTVDDWRWNNFMVKLVKPEPKPGEQLTMEGIE